MFATVDTREKIKTVPPQKHRFTSHPRVLENGTTIERLKLLVLAERAVDNTDPTIKDIFLVMTRDEGVFWAIFGLCIHCLLPSTHYAIDRLDIEKNVCLI